MSKNIVITYEDFIKKLHLLPSEVSDAIDTMRSGVSDHDLINVDYYKTLKHACDMNDSRAIASLLGDDTSKATLDNPMMKKIANTNVIIDCTNHSKKQYHKSDIAAILYYGISHKNPKIVDHIIDNKLSDIETIKYHEWANPLEAAAAFGSLEIVESLTRLNIQSWKEYDDSGKNALIIAIAKHYSGIVHYFLESGFFDVNKANVRNCTPLMTAARSGEKDDIIEDILAHGAEVDTQGYDGATALIMAVESRYEPSVKALLRHGANVNICTNRGGHAVITAIVSCCMNILELLLDAGTDINMKVDQSGSTLLTVAVQLKNSVTYAMIKTLLDHQADPNIARYDGVTPLMITSELGNLSIVKLLVDYGAKVDTLSTDGQSALSVADMHGHTNIREFLVHKITSSALNTELYEERTKTYLSGEGCKEEY